MTSKKGLICMSFDGEYVTEKRAEFDSVDSAWEHAEDMGSRWFFYPFYFVVSESGNTVLDAGHGLSFLKGKRVKTVSAFFKKVSELPEAKDSDTEFFVMLLQENQ